MADFNTQIVLAVKDQTAAALDKLQKRLNKISAVAGNIAIGGAKGAVNLADKNVKQYVNTLGKLDSKLGGLGKRLADVTKAFDFGGKTVVGIASINALAGALSNLPKAITGGTSGLQNLAGALSNLTSPIDAVVQGLQQIGPQGLAVGAGVATATAALMAFAPAAQRAAKGAKQFRESFKADFDLDQDIISEKTIRDALKAATAEQKKLSAGTAEYTRATEDVVALQRELTEELRRQEIIYNRVNSAQVAIAENVRKNVRASQATRKASGFEDFSKAAGAQTAIDKSIRRQREKLARQTKGAAAQPAQLALPSSEMLNAAERGIKQIRSVTDQLGEDLDYTNQRVRNFVDELRRGGGAADDLPPIFNKVNQSLEVINSNLKEATSRASRLAGSAAPGGKAQGPIQGRTAALRSLADLEKKLITEVAALRDKKALKSFQTRKRRLNYLAAEQKKFSAQLENIALGVGFPLLFGGGAGSVLGSGLGSFVGSGFGGQILGGAVGQSIDQAIASIGELGQALNPLTGDLNKVTEAAGLTGTALERQLQAVEKALGKEEALLAARELLAQRIGPEAVNALERVGDEFIDFQNNIAILGTRIAAFVAGPLAKFLDAINSGFESPQAQRIQTLDIAKQQFRSGTASPEIKALFEERQSLEGTAAERAERRLEINKEIVRVLNEQNAEYQKGLQAAIDNAAASRIKKAEEESSLEISRQQLIVANGANDLLNESVVAAERAIIAEETRLKLIKAQGDARLIEIALNEASAKKALLDARIAAAQDRANKATGGSGVDKEAQAQKALATEKLKQFDIETKLVKLTFGKEEALKDELSRLDQRAALEREQIRLSTEDARVQAAKLDTLDQSTNLRRTELQIQLKQLETERAIAQLKAQQNLTNVRTGLEQELAGKQLLPTGDQFGDALNQQKLEQAIRYQNTIRGVTDAIDQLKIAEAGAVNAEQRGLIQEKIKDQERLKATYEEMLPAIFAAEQAQLKFSQTLSLIQGPINAGVSSLVSGLREVAAGTKTAEEAFADFLTSIADQLINTAAQMIAQYIAIGIARQFAGIPAAGGSGSANFGGFGQSPGSALGGLSFLADGGPATAGKPYIVGEQGPELFVPGRSGTVIPNDAMGGGNEVVINNTFTPGPGGMTAEDQARVARQMQSIVTGTLMREKRPGGILSK